MDYLFIPYAVAMYEYGSVCVCVRVRTSPSVCCSTFPFTTSLLSFSTLRFWRNFVFEKIIGGERIPRREFYVAKKVIFYLGKSGGLSRAASKKENKIYLPSVLFRLWRAGEASTLILAKYPGQGQPMSEVR